MCQELDFCIWLLQNVFGLIASIQPIWVVFCSRLVDKLMSSKACSYSDCLIDSHISAHGEYLADVLQNDVEIHSSSMYGYDVLTIFS